MKINKKYVDKVIECRCRSWVRPVDRGPWTVDRGPWTVDRGSWTVDRGPWTVGRGPWAVGRGPWAVGRGPWTVDLWTHNVADDGDEGSDEEDPELREATGGEGTRAVRLRLGRRDMEVSTRRVNVSLYCKR